MKDLIAKFNQETTRLVISDYPEENKRGTKSYGIAWYTKKLVESLAQNYHLKFVVLGEKTYSDKPTLYENGRILVLRVFDQKRPTLFPRILSWLSVFNKVRCVDIHSEFCTNGGIKNFTLLLPFMLLIKLTGRHTTYFAHNIVTDLNGIAPHLGYKKNSTLVKALNVCLHLFYRVLGIVADRFIVMDETIYNRLTSFVSPEKIHLLPFWVEKSPTTFTKTAARGKLSILPDEFVLLYFGFITYYKGADWLVDTVKELQKQRKFANIRLVLAGGEAYSLKEKSYYQRFYRKVLEEVARQPKIQLTGFVPEDDIQTYFAAADLVVFPYRGLIGSSGALSHAISYQKPFILSTGLKAILKSDNAKSSLTRCGLAEKDITFSHTVKSLGQLLARAQKKEMLQRLTGFSTSLAQSHSKDGLLEACYSQLYATDDHTRYSPASTLLAIPSTKQVCQN